MLRPISKKIQSEGMNSLDAEIISPRTREEIELNYMQNKTLPISDVKSPPSPNDSFKNTITELNELEKSKFIDNFDINIFKDLYSNIKHETIEEEVNQKSR